jgi:hypothetical protein
VVVTAEGGILEGVCWICGAAASSAEHKAKKSDLKAVFGEISQTDRLHLHDALRRNRHVGSFETHRLKWPRRLCEHCNTTLTQGHDRASEDISDWLRNRKPSIEVDMKVHATQRFPRDVHRKLLNMHLYFVKMMGCCLVEVSVPIDLVPFSRAILDNRAHPDLYLRFGRGKLMGHQQHVGLSDLVALKRNDVTVCAVCIYTVGPVAAQMFYWRADEAPATARASWDENSFLL